jgi:spermidine synthase
MDATDAHPPHARGALIVALTAFGAAGLGLEIVGSMWMALVIGSSSLATTATVAGSFGGMAIGAWWAHGRATRSDAPWRELAITQAGAAMWSALAPWWVATRLTGETRVPLGSGTSSELAWAAAAMLVPVGFALGAGFPLAVESWRRFDSHALADRAAGWTAATWGLGSTLGIASVTAWLVPSIGLTRTTWTLAGASWLGSFLLMTMRREATAAPTREPPAAAVPEAAALRMLSFVSGALAVAVEVVGIQVLDQRSSGTHLALASVTAVFVLGGALGNALGARLITRQHERPPLLRTAGLTWVVAMTLALSPGLVRAAWELERVGGAETLVPALALLGLPSIGLGAVHAQISGAFVTRGVGRIEALDYAGGALGGGLAGMLLAPVLGFTDAWTALLLAAALASGAAAWRIGAGERAVATAGTALAIVGVLGHATLEATPAERGWTEVARRVTPLGVIVVTEADRPAPAGAAASVLRRLRVNDRFRMGGTLAFAEGRMGRIPVALHPDPRRVLVLGLGTGATAGAALVPAVESLDGVELVPEIVEFLPWFASANGELHRDPRVKIHVDDARRFIARSPGPGTGWDVIIGDLIHPRRAGAGRLFSTEHFRAIRARLGPEGMFVQWLPLHQLSPDSLRTIVRTFVGVFGEAPMHGWLASFDGRTPALGLIGFSPRSAGLRVDVERWAERNADPDAERLDVRDPARVLAGHVLDGAALRALGGSGPVERDARPRVAWMPEPSSPTAARLPSALETVLEHRRPIPAAASSRASPEFLARVATIASQVLPATVSSPRPAPSASDASAPPRP